MNKYASTSIEDLTCRLINDVLNSNNFENPVSSKGSFLTGGSIIICESKGLQEYIQKTCVDIHGIWTALSFKPLAGFLMQCAYNLSKDKKDESENLFNPNNLVWAVYNLLKEPQQTFYYAGELASLFFAYQIYRPEIIKKWNKGEKYTIPDAGDNFSNNENMQRTLWGKIKDSRNDEKDITRLYDLFDKPDKKVLPKQVYIFSPVSIAPVQFNALKSLSKAGCGINLYIHQISNQYTGEARSDKRIIADLRKQAWENNKILDEKKLYWDIGNRLNANLGRSAQVLYEQIGWDSFDPFDISKKIIPDTLLGAIQEKILNDDNEEKKREPDNSLVINSCFSPLREVEVLCDYLLNLFEENKDLSPADIAVVSPNIENYANAIDSVFGRYDLPYAIADRDVKKHDKTVRLLNMLFSLPGSRYEAPDIISLYEYSMYAQDAELDPNDAERLEKWVKENAVRHGFVNQNNDNKPPDYTFKTGFDQLSAGFFMISENGFSDNGDYCYPDIEGNQAEIISNFFNFTESLKFFIDECFNKKTIEDWDYFFRENLKCFFGADEMNFNEEDENPYQKVISAWDDLKKEMLTGFGNNSGIKIDFSILKMALPAKLEEKSKPYYTLSGRMTFANMETLRAVPHRIICCIGMNGKEFPRQNKFREMSLMPELKTGDKDAANEDRFIFLETLCGAKEKLYISWIGQNEKTAEKLDPSAVVIMLLKNLKEQYGIEPENIVREYPLQPFSARYFNGELDTYDNRWNRIPDKNPDSDVWNWRVKKDHVKETNDVDELYRILNDAPKYFIKEICNITLPEDVELLENLEPFVIDSALDKWNLANMIINNKKEIYMNNIEVLKRKGELPDGDFAKKLIENIIITAEELKKLAANEKPGAYWIYPSEDKGKYRLKHWLKHLDLNIKTENQNTKMFLKKDGKPVILKLKGVSKNDAERILKKLWEVKKELEERLVPVFPNAAWILAIDGDMEGAENAIFSTGEYDFSAVSASQYAKMAFGNAESLEGKLKKDFIKYSNILFDEYMEYFQGTANEAA